MSEGVPFILIEIPKRDNTVSSSAEFKISTVPVCKTNKKQYRFFCGGANMGVAIAKLRGSVGGIHSLCFDCKYGLEMVAEIISLSERGYGTQKTEQIPVSKIQLQKPLAV